MILALFKAAFVVLSEYYADPLPIFFDEKEPETYFSYKSFRIQSFRGLNDVSLNFTRSDLTLLLGLNESGKTSILKAVEAFDFNNDPTPDELKQFFTSMRNKQDIDSSQPCLITADIEFTEALDFNFFKKVFKAANFGLDVKTEVDTFLAAINGRRSVRVSRVIPFVNGSPGKSYYQFEEQKPFSQPMLGRILAQEIIRRCPFILYFEDFQDSIPDKIFTQKRSDAFNSAWYEIIDGLFYNTDSTYSIKKYETYFSSSNPREDDARSVLKKVNKTLQRTFTEKWQNLSGVQDIEEAEITYNPAKKHFQIKVTEKDGTTFSVHERSKGAIWYLAFLMKTEFRRKKLREGSGKPIYLIDEPASNLHSTAQQKMVDDFYALVEDTTLVYTTHSRYLISPSNVRNTYVVRRSDGVVTCTRWGDYIHGRDAQISYYQPLYDCLNVVPNNFDIPWEKAIITEGPSDALTLDFMERILGEPHTHAVYPGTSASNLSTLISLNLGWGVDFRVLLDSDPEGRDQRERYMDEFGLGKEVFVMLPAKNVKIEKMFEAGELEAMHELALGEKKRRLSKKEFLALMRTLESQHGKWLGPVGRIIKEATRRRFSELFRKLKAS